MATFPELYEQHLVGPLFHPWAELLLDLLGIRADQSFLDVACGTGIVARGAKKRQASRVVGIDLNPEMLSVAKTAAPDLDWRQGDAAKLPLADGEQFDTVACHQGLQFFADKQSALSEMKRAARPGAQIGIAVWRSDAEVPIFRMLREVAETTLGPISDSRHNLANLDDLEKTAETLGYKNWTHQVHTIECEFNSAPQFLKLNTQALIGMSGKELTDEERAQIASKIEAESQPVIEEFLRGEKLVFETRSNILLASV